MLPPSLVSYLLLGFITAPLAVKLVKPLLRGVVKTTVGLALQAKKLTTEVVEDVQDLAAQASAEMVSAQRTTDAAITTGPATATAETVHSRGAVGATR